MTSDDAANDRLHQWVTVGGEIVHGGDIEVTANQMLKVGTFYRSASHHDGDDGGGTMSGAVTLVSDEGQSLGGGGSAPSPLQYFLSGIGF